jgi:hypothetical protein
MFTPCRLHPAPPIPAPFMADCKRDGQPDQQASSRTH